MFAIKSEKGHVPRLHETEFRSVAYIGASIMSLGDATDTVTVRDEHGVVVVYRNGVIVEGEVLAPFIVTYTVGGKTYRERVYDVKSIPGTATSPPLHTWHYGAGVGARVATWDVLSVEAVEAES